MMKLLRFLLILTILIPLLAGNGLMAKDMRNIGTKPKFNKGSAIPDPALQRAIGILEKGKLKTTTWNYGVFTGSNFSSNPYPEGLWGPYQYIPTLCLLFGVPGRDANGNPYPWAVGKKYIYSREINDYTWVGDDTTYWGPTVSESYMDRTDGQIMIDWEAAGDAATRLHGTVTAGEIYGGTWARMDDQNPVMATSDVPGSWPLKIDAATGDETPYWPGPWATDTSGAEMEGVFVSDEDVYFEFDDRLASRDVDPSGRLQGYPIGVKALVSAYSYGASVAEDIIFFNMRLVNISDSLGLNGGLGYDYEGAYGGFWFDVDSYHRTRDGSTSGRSNDDDMMSFNTEWDFAFIWDYDDNSNGATGLAYSALKLLETPRATEQVTIENEFGTTIINPGEKLGLTDWHWMNWYQRPMADDGGPNGPFTGDGETPNAPDGEAILYKIMSGDTSGTDSYGTYRDANGELVEFDRRTYNQTHYFHEAPDGNLYPHFDSYRSLRQDFPDGLDCVFIMSSGPFTFAVGDTIPFSFAIIMGSDSTDLVVNAKIAQLMYDNFYRGPTPPTAPNVSVLEEDEKVTLFWDDVSINSRDALTKIKDFEGFRIYKSTDNGLTWGEQRSDDSTNTSWWVPIAQFDLDNEIRGHDPIAPHRFLGENSGLKFQFTDTDVQNGVEYLYAVCAYDRGFIAGDPLRDSVAVTQGKFSFKSQSLENFLSNSDRLPHIIRAIPHRAPGNVRQDDVIITKIDTTKGNGQFEIQVVDTKKLTGHDYLIYFHADMSTGLPQNPTYDIIDLVTGDTLLKNSTNFINLDPQAPPFKTIPPRFHGLEWIIKSATGVNVDQTENGIHWVGQCNYEVTANLIKKAVSDYRIVFVGEGAEPVYKVTDTTQVVFNAPFEVWNMLAREGGQIKPKKAKVTVFDKAPLNEWNSGDQFYLYEKGLTGLNPGETARTLRFTFTWSDTPYVDPVSKTVKPAHRKWAVGDTLFIPVQVPFHEGDGFKVQTRQIYQVQEAKEEDLKKIKVVPNPYIAKADWEFDEFNRKIQFTNLPSKCTIYIFNVAGELVQTLYHDNLFDGSENWNLWTSNRQEAAPGLYIWVVKTPDGKKETGKFTIIR
ncbi:MAG: hypothetical protein Kow0037_15500 [Calditrichia bacterium]